MTSEPIQRRKLYQEVLDRLMQRIERAELQPGDQLPSERELMETYGVGRVAVREALQEMARSGIVEISHGERARIVTPTAGLLIDQIAEGARHLLRIQPETLEHLKEARVFLEIGMVRLAAEKATDDDIRNLYTRHEAQRAALADSEQFMNRAYALGVVHETHRAWASSRGGPLGSASCSRTGSTAQKAYSR
jgi:DNA-binding FadR family transcriptional regulator